MTALTVTVAACSSSHKASSTTSHVASDASTTAAAVTSSSVGATTTTVGITPPTSVATATATSVPATAPKSCNNGTSSTAIYDAQNGYYATAPKTVDTGNGTLRYDVVQFLVGDDAKTAWARDNPTDPDGPPNDYYVVNENPAIYASPFAPDVRVFDIADEGNPSSMQVDSLTGFETRMHASQDTSGVYDGHLFWVRLGAGKITELCEQWVP
ncbi:MAG TPA: hypothetical protein VGO03_17510 [Acidimicrobiia bacterium]